MNNKLSEKDIQLLVDSYSSLLMDLSIIGVRIIEAKPLLDEEIIQYNISVPQESILYRYPECTAEAAKEILINNAKIYGIEKDSIKVLYKIRLDETWSIDSIEKVMSVAKEVINESIYGKGNNNE